MLQLLLDRKIHYDMLYESVIKYGTLEMLKLIEKYNILKINNSLLLAVEYNDNIIIKYLIKSYEWHNSGDDIHIIGRTIKNNNVEILKILYHKFKSLKSIK